MAKCFRDHALKKKGIAKNWFPGKKNNKDFFKTRTKRRMIIFDYFPENKEIFLRGAKKIDKRKSKK